MPEFTIQQRVLLTKTCSPGADAVLRNITLQVEPGQHIAICGRSGSGKTSLVLSLLRMLDMPTGRVVLEGVDVTADAISAADVRSRINVVPQDPFLLPGTSVRSNVDSFANDTASDESIITALQQVGLWDIIQAAGGLDKNVDVLSLSAGQKQLLCFARALVRRPSCGILLLDEATSK